jgi:hypothetical protein
VNFNKLSNPLTKIALILLLLIGISLTSLYFALKSPKVQTFVAHLFTENLSKQLGFPIQVEQIEVDWFNTIIIDKLYVQDLNSDTLLFIDHSEAKLSYFSLFQKKISLDQIVINNFYLNIERNFKDSLYNIDHLKLGGFSSTNVKESEQKSSNLKWNIVFNELTINNLKLNNTDYYSGNIITTAIDKMALSFSYMKFGDNNIKLDFLDIVCPTVLFLKQESNPDFIKHVSLNKSFYLPLNLENDVLRINDGSFAFKNIQKSDTTFTRFDANDFELLDINLRSEDLLISYDSLHTEINLLGFKEKSGFRVESLLGSLEFTNQLIAFKQLNLITSHSHIESDVLISFENLNSFDNFIEDVYFSIDLSPSFIHSKDLAFFIESSEFRFVYPIKLEGNLYGRVSNFKAKDLKLKTGRNSVFEGNFSMNGLPDVKGTFISGRVDRIFTEYNDLLRIYPSLPMPENIAKLGKLVFSGKFDGFINDFVTQGSLTTELGSVRTDLNLKLDDLNNASYSGKLALNEFDIGTYFGLEESFGKISLKGEAKGKGLKLNTLDVELSAVIEKVEMKKYDYENIQVDGRFKDRYFSGHLEIQDENIAVDFDGDIDMSNPILVFKFEADIERLNLKALNIWGNDMIIKSKLTADFSASNINNVIGNVFVQNLDVSKGKNNYDIGDINLTSRLLENDEKRFLLTSRDFDASIQGKFEFSKILNAVKSVIIPNYTELVVDQLLRFELNIRQDPEILHLFVPELKVLRPSIIEGNFDSNSKSMLALVNMPVVQYKNFSIVDWTSSIYVNHGEFDIINSIPFIYLKDSLLVKDFSFLAKGPRTDLILKVFADGQKESSVELIANIITKNDRVKLEFQPSNIFINNQFWLIDEKNEIILGERISSRNLKLYNGISELLIDLELNAQEQKSDIFLSNIFLQDFTQFLYSRNIDLKGIANGKISVSLIDNEPGIYGDLMIENIEINQYKVGNLNTNAILDLPNKKIKINGNLYGEDNEVDINGSYSFAKEVTPKDFDIKFDIKNFAIYSIEEFIPQYIDNTSGTVSGKLSLTGPRNRPDLLGYIDINDVTTTVTFLKTTYNVKNQSVRFEKNAINLGQNLKITDIDGNTAYGKGVIYHKNLRDIGLNIEVWTEKIMALNTTIEDNQDFYGTAYLKGNAIFKGLTNDIAINISGESEGKTEIAIPLTEDGSSNDYTFYTFVRKKLEEDKEFLVSSVDKFKVNGVTVKLDLDIDNDCRVKIILDQTTGDVLEVKGEGNIKINVPKEGDVLFFGSYVIGDGDYLFTLQNIVNKRFRIEPNSSINFQGKIEDTQVNVSAIYGLRAATANLIRDFLEGSVDEQLKGEAENRVPVKLLLSLENNLFNPDITFDIQIDQLNPTIRNFVDRKIFTLKQYENEMNRQVFGLLVLGQFLPPLSSIDQVAGGGFNINASDAANTVSEFLSNQLTRYFNDWLSYLSDDVSLNFNYRNYESDVVTSLDDLSLRRELQLALTTKFLNDRVTINVGGNVDFGANQLGTENTNTTYFGGNASIEYALTENRRFRIKAFTTTDYDYFNQANNTRAGVGLSFKREFDEFKDLKISKDEFKLRPVKNDSIE